MKTNRNKKTILAKNQITTGIILLGLPLFLIILIMILNPEFILSMKQHASGKIILCWSFTWWILGAITLFGGSILLNLVKPLQEKYHKARIIIQILVYVLVFVIFILPVIACIMGGPVIVNFSRSGIELF